MYHFMASEEDKDKKEKDAAGSFGIAEKLFKARTLFVCGEIDQKLAKEFMMQIIALAEDSEDAITVYLNSQGGHVEAGDTIHDMIRYVKPRIKIVGTGWVASAGAHIYISVPKEDRFSLPNTRFLIHQPMGGVGGRASDIKIEAEQIVEMRKRLNKIIAKQTGQPLERVEADTQRNYWMTAPQAIEYGLVGRIIESIDELK